MPPAVDNLSHLAGRAPSGPVDDIAAQAAGLVQQNRAGGRIDTEALARDLGAATARDAGQADPPHSAHRRGNEVDIRPLRTDGRNLPTNISDPSYDRAATRALIELIREQHPDAFNDPVLVREGLSRDAPGHGNHLHVRIP